MIRDDIGKVQGVRYDELAPMLLNEMQQRIKDLKQDALRKHRSEIRNIVARHGALAPRVFGSAIHGA